MKQLVRKDVNNSGVESAVEEVNEPDVVVQLLTYQMLINRGLSAVGTTNSKTADEQCKENQQLSEQMLNNLLIYIQTQSTVEMERINGEGQFRSAAVYLLKTGEDRRRRSSAGALSVDDISSDITFSRKLKAISSCEEKRKREKRCRTGIIVQSQDSVHQQMLFEIQQMVCALVIISSRLQCIQQAATVSLGNPVASISRPTTGQPAASISLPPAGQPDASTSSHPVLRPASGQPVESTSSQLLQ
ncbi:U-box domain-containing protein 9-like [Dorcoceras hygrometricum]|uniref:U-box domain-containing protein 9-like n=1 Tax=Dorcoceras hygrometricum TaxID=472368 RepID=A0A2Z7BHP0_9LAMI|nr:U-box domain-containing protein 9-like [Dorcoceras hygrometricum]